MTDEQYKTWRSSDPANQRARFLRGSRDKIVVMGVPTGRECDGYIEGTIIQSDVPSLFPVGYVSMGWVREAFDLIEGEVSFKEHSSETPSKQKGSPP